jgi:hypothetical protein
VGGSAGAGRRSRGSSREGRGKKAAPVALLLLLILVLLVLFVVVFFSDVVVISSSPLPLYFLDRKIQGPRRG